MINRNLPLFAIGKTDLFRTEAQGQEMFVLQMELTRLESTGRRNLFRLAERDTQEILLNQDELRELADLLALAASGTPPAIIGLPLDQTPTEEENDEFEKWLHDDTFGSDLRQGE